MTTIPCPECGHQTFAEAAACANCGKAMKNGTVQQTRSPAEKPPPPPEVSNWVIEKPPPEIIEEAIRTFKMEEFLASVREIEETGGLRFEDFVEELERAAGEHD